jgi:hypothetical protein
MNTTKALFSELVYDFQSERWNEFELPKLSLRELQTLAKLLGCASYGTKEALIVRLLAQRELRFKLACFTDNPEELAISYRRESLRDMCREAGIWRSGKQTRSFGRSPQLARSVPSTRTGVSSRNPIASQRPAATAHFPLPTFVITEGLQSFYVCAAFAPLSPR